MDVSAAYAVLVPLRKARVRASQEGASHDDSGDLLTGVLGPAEEGRAIASQTAALRAHAAQLDVELPDEWMFEDEGHSGATLLRPGLERLPDLVAGVGVDVILCYS